EGGGRRCAGAGRSARVVRWAGGAGLRERCGGDGAPVDGGAYPDAGGGAGSAAGVRGVDLQRGAGCAMEGAGRISGGGGSAGRDGGGDGGEVAGAAESRRGADAGPAAEPRLV